VERRVETTRLIQERLNENVHTETLLRRLLDRFVEIGSSKSNEKRLHRMYDRESK